VGSGERKITYIQCQDCGSIYRINRKISIEKSIVNVECSRCGSYVGLNCGNKKDDVYLYMNPNVDKRYYIY
jgi:uncharacterized OB-fold protein